MAAFGLPPDALIRLVDMILIGMPLAIGILILLFVFASAGKKKRVQNRRIARAKLDRGPRPVQAGAISVRRSTTYSDIQLLDVLIKRVLPRPEILRARLSSAGLEISLGIYIVINIVAVVFAGFAVQLSGFLPPVGAVMAGLGIGIMVPHLVVGFLRKRRQKKFIAYFPDAIDLMVRGLKAGLPITESIKAAADEISDPVGWELKRVTDGMRLGRKVDELLWETAQRIDVPEFKFFTVSLSIQSETGGNLTETLNNLADVLRRRKQLGLKIKALSSEAKASAYIIGSLPFLMFAVIYALNAEYVMPLLTDPRGNMMLGGALATIGVGAGVMYKMLRFEI